jgi:hypothetical protein
MTLTVKEAEAVVALARQRLRDAEAELTAAMNAECPFKIGDVVRTRKGEFVITELYREYSAIRGRGNKRLKNGEFGDGEHTFGLSQSWDKAELVRRP